MPSVKISPSILAADFARLGEEVRAVDEGGADYIHVDVMDGHFVPNLTIGLPVVEALRKVTDKVLDVHLMISNAEAFIERYAEAGADLIIVHVEAVNHLHSALQRIRAAGKKACVSLNPATPLSVLDYVLEDLDMVLLMTVNPGFGGQAFIDSVLPKVERLREAFEKRGLDTDIEVDGGIKVDNVARVASAGANVIVSGSGIFGKDDYASTIAELRRRATEAA